MFQSRSKVQRSMSLTQNGRIRGLPCDPSSEWEVEAFKQDVFSLSSVSLSVMQDHRQVWKVL